MNQQDTDLVQARLKRIQRSQEQEQLELARRKMINERNKLIASVIKPLPISNYGADIEVRELHAQIERYTEEYELILNPDFQRGHVWTQAQQIAFIESWIRGGIGEQGRTISFNCPDFAGRSKSKDCDLDGMVCLDGLQRLTAVLGFVEGKFRVFTNPDIEEFKDGLDYEYFNFTAFSMRTQRLRFQVFCMQKKTQLLDYYLSFNDGGTQHSESELNRVREMRSKLES